MESLHDHPKKGGYARVPWYDRVRSAINAAMPFLWPTQKTNLALLVSAILKKAHPLPLGVGPLLPHI
jgi:hypothetical protein